MFGSLKKKKCTLNCFFYPLKTETTLVEKHLCSYSQIKLLGRAPDFTVHPKGDGAGLVDGAACNNDGVWARSSIYPMPSCIMNVCDGWYW